MATNAGNREMQFFLIGYIIISICEIFSVGAFPLNEKVRIVRVLARRLFCVLQITDSRRHFPPFTLA